MRNTLKPSIKQNPIKIEEKSSIDSHPKSDFLHFETNNEITITSYFLNIYDEESDNESNKENFVEVENHENELISILNEEGITVYKNPINRTSTQWLRDPFICLSNNQYLIRSSAIKIENNKLVKSILEKDPLSHYNRSSLNSILDGAYASMGKAANNTDYEFISEELKKYNIGFSEMRSLLEGGNMLTLIINDQTYFIIGKYSIAATVVFRLQDNLSDKEYIEKIKNEYQKENINPLYRALNDDSKMGIHVGHFKEAKETIYQNLNVSKDKVIWVPNPSFHIDMWMTVGNGVIFLTNFKLLGDLMNKYPDNEEARKIQQYAYEFHQSYGGILDKIKSKFKKKGIPVIEVPGVAYVRNKKDELVCLANFMNAYSGKGKKGVFFITLTSESQILRNEFLSILKQNGVNVYFIGSPKLTDELLNEYKGALRCLSIQGGIYDKSKSTEDSPNGEITRLIESEEIDKENNSHKRKEIKTTNLFQEKQKKIKTSDENQKNETPNINPNN